MHLFDLTHSWNATNDMFEHLKYQILMLYLDLNHISLLRLAHQLMKDISNRCHAINSGFLHYLEFLCLKSFHSIGKKRSLVDDLNIATLRELGTILYHRMQLYLMSRKFHCQKNSPTLWILNCILAKKVP